MKQTLIATSEFGERVAFSQGVQILSNVVTSVNSVVPGVSSSKPDSVAFSDLFANATENEATVATPVSGKRGGDGDSKEKDMKAPQVSVDAIVTSTYMPQPVAANLVQSVDLDAELQPREGHTDSDNGDGKMPSIGWAGGYSGHPVLGGSLETASGLNGSAAKGSPGASEPVTGNLNVGEVVAENTAAPFLRGSKGGPLSGSDGERAGGPKTVVMDHAGRMPSVAWAGGYSGQPLLDGSLEDASGVIGAGKRLAGAGEPARSGPTVSWPIAQGAEASGVSAIEKDPSSEGEAALGKHVERTPGVTSSGEYFGQPILGGSIESAAGVNGSAGQGSPNVSELVAANANVSELVAQNTTSSVAAGLMQRRVSSREASSGGVVASSAATSLPTNAIHTGAAFLQGAIAASTQPELTVPTVVTVPPALTLPPITSISQAQGTGVPGEDKTAPQSAGLSLQDVAANASTVQDAVVASVSVSLPSDLSSPLALASPDGQKAVTMAGDDTSQAGDAAVPAVSSGSVAWQLSESSKYAVSNAVSAPLLHGTASPAIAGESLPVSGTTPDKTSDVREQAADGVQEQSSAGETAPAPSDSAAVNPFPAPIPDGATSQVTAAAVVAPDGSANASQISDSKGAIAKQGSAGKNDVRTEAKVKRSGTDLDSPALAPAAGADVVEKSKETSDAAGQKGSGTQTIEQGKAMVQAETQVSSAPALGGGAIGGQTQGAPAHGTSAAAPAASTTVSAGNAGVAANVDSMSGAGLSGASLTRSVHQSEMKIGMNSEEFGSISIQTSVTRQTLSTQISVEHAALGTALMTHIPSMQERLGSSYGLQTRVEVSRSSGDASGSAAGSSSGGRREQASDATRGSYATPGAAAGLSQSTASYAAGSSRLDVHF